jgi:hypothetical protein
MFAWDELQRWAGRTCLLLVAVLGMLGYHFANVRFLPVMAGFAILAAVCYMPRSQPEVAHPLRNSGHHPAL